MCDGQVEMSNAGSHLVVKLVTSDAAQGLTCNVLLILMNHCDSNMLFSDLAAQYRQVFAADLSISQLQNELSGFVEVKYHTAWLPVCYLSLDNVWCDCCCYLKVMMLKSMQMVVIPNFTQNAANILEAVIPNWTLCTGTQFLHSLCKKLVISNCCLLSISSRLDCD